jgi:transitional endoplasmic reticulum ATPase
MPDQVARQELVINVKSKTVFANEKAALRLNGDNLNVGELAVKTDGFSGADITEVFRRLCLSRAMQEARTGQDQPPITQTEIEQEIQNFRQNG